MADGTRVAFVFASSEILARWADIVGPEIAVHCEPMKINWPRQNGAGTLGEETPEPATLVLRVEGPAALEIQHMSAVILERVNRFFAMCFDCSFSMCGKLAVKPDCELETMKQLGNPRVCSPKSELAPSSHFSVSVSPSRPVISSPDRSQ